MHVGSFYEQSTRIKLLPLFNTYFSTRKVAQWSLLHCCLEQSEKSLWVFLQYFPWKVLSMPIAEFYVSFAGKQTNSFRIKIGRGGHTRHLLRHRFTTNKLSPVTIPLNIVYRKLSWNSVGESFSYFRVQQNLCRVVAVSQAQLWLKEDDLQPILIQAQVVNKRYTLQ